MNKTESSRTIKEQRKASTKVLLYEVLWFLTAMLVWHIVFIYYNLEPGLIFAILFYVILILGDVCIIKAFQKKKQLHYQGVMRLLIYLVIAFVLLQMHLKQIDMYREVRLALQSREYPLKKSGKAIIEYSKAHGGSLPSSDNWCDELKSFESKLSYDSFDAQCRMEPHCTVAFNKNISGTNLQSLSSNTVLVFESEGPWNLSGGSELLYAQSKDNEFAYLFLADGKTYKYYFSQEQAKDISNNSYVSIQWKP